MATRQEALDRLRAYRDRVVGCSSFEEYRDAHLRFISASIADMESDHEREREVVGHLMDEVTRGMAKDE